MSENKKGRPAEAARIKDKSTRFIPKKLRKINHWSLWTWTDEVNKRTGEIERKKRPVKGMRYAGLSYTEARKMLEQDPETYAGLSFDFADTPFSYIDLDTYKLAEDDPARNVHKEIVKAARVVTFVERSQSGGGYHIIYKGDHIPAGGVIDTRTDGILFVTGDSVGKRKIRPLPQEIIDMVKEAAGTTVDMSTEGDILDEIRTLAAPFSNADKVIALAEGDTDGYPSASEADLAFCTHLAYLVDGDEEEIDRLFRGSALYRDKWERDDYRQRTMERAIAAAKKDFKRKLPENISQAIREAVEMRIDLNLSTTPDDICRYLLGLNPARKDLRRVMKIIRTMKSRGKIHQIGRNLVLDTGIVDVAMADLFSDKKKLKMHPVVMPGDLHKIVPLNEGGTMAVIGETNAGKTSFAVELLVLNVMAGRKVEYFSNESTEQEIHSAISTMVRGKRDRELFKRRYKETGSRIAVHPVISEEMFDPAAICIFDYVSVSEGAFHEIYARVKKATEMFTPWKGCLFLLGQRDAGKKNPVGGNKFFQPVRAAVDIGKLYYAGYRVLTVKKSKFPGADGKDYEGRSNVFRFDGKRRLKFEKTFQVKSVDDWKKELQPEVTLNEEIE